MKPRCSHRTSGACPGCYAGLLEQFARLRDNVLGLEHHYSAACGLAFDLGRELDRALRAEERHYDRANAAEHRLEELVEQRTRSETTRSPAVANGRRVVITRSGGYDPESPGVTFDLMLPGGSR